jgi:hypothetical protein
MLCSIMYKFYSIHVNFCSRSVHNLFHIYVYLFSMNLYTNWSLCINFCPRCINFYFMTVHDLFNLYFFTLILVMLSIQLFILGI